MSVSKTQTQTPAVVWALTITASLVFGLIFLAPYLAVTILGLLLSFIFYPMYSWLYKKFKSQAKAAWLTTVSSVLIVGLPLIIILTITAAQALNLVDDLTANGIAIIEGESLEQTLEGLTSDLNQRIENITGSREAIDIENVRSFVESTIPNVLRAVSDSIIGIVSGVPTFFTLLIIYFFVFVAGLVNGKKIRKIIEQISPFDKETNKLYLDRLGAMAKAMMKGQFLIALAQGIESAAVLSLFGFADYFLFFAVGFTFLSFIPLGAGIITIPLGILMILLGNVWGGVIVLLNHFLVVTNIDNYIRPKVVPDNARLPAALTILGAFAGVAYFGFLGVIYGPMIMIFITTTIESYIKYKERTEKSNASKASG